MAEKTRVKDRVLNPDNSPRQGKVTFVLLRAATGNSGLIPASSTVSCELVNGWFDVWLVASVNLNPQAYYNLLFQPANGVGRENLGIYAIPDSGTLQTLAPNKITDTNIIARYKLADETTVLNLANNAAAAALDALTSEQVDQKLVKWDSAISKFKDSKITETPSGATLNGTLTADGITAPLNAANLNSGTIPDARFPATLPAASGQNLTNLPAANLTGQIPSGALPNSANFSGTVQAGAFVGNGAGLTGITGATGGVANVGSTTIGADTDNNDVGVVDIQTKNTTRLRVDTPQITAFVPVVLNADPSAALQAATKQYVDAAATPPEAALGSFPTAGAAYVRKTIKATDGNRDFYDCVLSGGVYQWRSRNGGVYRTRDFGIKGDGVTDDTAAWQALLNAVPNDSVIEVETGSIFEVGNLVITSKQGVRIRHRGGTLTPSGRFRYNGADGGIMFLLNNCYNVEFEGVSFYNSPGKKVGKHINYESTGGGFSSKGAVRNCFFYGEAHNWPSYIAIDVNSGAAFNHENYEFEFNTIQGGYGSARWRADNGTGTSGSTTLTASDGNFSAVTDLGKKVRVNVGGTTFSTTIAGVPNSTTLTLDDPLPGDVKSGRIYIGESFGIGIRTGNAADTKHNLFYGNQITECDIGIQVLNGSATIKRLGGGYSRIGIEVTSPTETIFIEEQVQEGNLQDIVRPNGFSAATFIVGCRGENTHQLAEGFYSLLGKVHWIASQLAVRPPRGGKVLTSSSPGNLTLLIESLTPNSDGVGSLDDLGVPALIAGGARVGFANTTIQGASMRGAGMITIGDHDNFLSHHSLLTPGGYALQMMGSLGTTTYLPTVAPTYRLHNIHAANSLVYGDGAIEIFGLQRAPEPTYELWGVKGVTTRVFCLVAKDTAGRRSLRSHAAYVQYSNATLSATNFIRLKWSYPLSLGTGVVFDVWELNFNQVNSQARIVATNIAAYSYDVVANPSGSFANIDTLNIPARSENLTTFHRGAQAFPEEITGVIYAGDGYDVQGISDLVTNNGSAQNIDNFYNGMEGQILRLRANDANTTLRTTGNLKLRGGANLLLTNGLIYHFVKRGNYWYEL